MCGKIRGWHLTHLLHPAGPIFPETKKYLIAHGINTQFKTTTNPNPAQVLIIFITPNLARLAENHKQITCYDAHTLSFALTSKHMSTKQIILTWNAEWCSISSPYFFLNLKEGAQVFSLLLISCLHSSMSITLSALSASLSF